MIDNVKEIKEILKEWTGCNAKLWSYSDTSKKLIIRLKKKSKGNLHLICSACRYIDAAAYWTIGSIEITPFRDDTFLNTAYKIHDEIESFEVRCLEVFLEQDVEPVY